MMPRAVGGLLTTTFQLGTPNQAILVAESVLLFVVLPLAFRYKFFPFPPIPALWRCCSSLIS
jgi:hypothetical protein